MEIGVRRYDPTDVQKLDADERILGQAAPALTGITVLLDGEVSMACGITHLMGEPEAWVCVKKDPSAVERLTIARVAKAYLAHLNPERAYAHVLLDRPEHLRFAEWLGFRIVHEAPTVWGPIAKLRYEGSHQ